MKKIVVGMGDMGVCNDPDSEVVTYALGSCIGLAVYDPHVGAGGLIHYMLPESKLNPDKSKVTPCMFADTGIPLLFKELYAMGATNRHMIIKA